MTDAELKLWERAKSGDESAVHEIFNNYLPLVRSIALTYYRVGIEFDDLVQNGSLGLLKAIKRFKPIEHFILAPYARIIINTEIQAGFRKEKMITVPYHAVESSKIPDKKFLSLDLVVSKEEGTMTLGDTIPSFELPISFVTELAEEKRSLGCALDELPSLERTLLSLRHGLIGPERPLSECAAILNISEKEAQRTEEKALMTLRSILKGAQ